MARKKTNQEFEKTNAETNEEMPMENVEAASQEENALPTSPMEDETSNESTESIDNDDTEKNSNGEVENEESSENENKEEQQPISENNQDNEQSDNEAIRLEGEESPEKDETSQASAVRFKVLEFYNPDGTRKRESELSKAENMARDSQINHRIVSGTIEAAIRNQQFGAYATVDYHGLTVVIPAKKMGLNYDDIERQVTARYRNTHQGDVNSTIIQAEVDRRAKNQIAEMVGGRIQFEIVGGVDGVVAGDREHALMRMKRYYFFTSTNAVQVGDKITGNIVRVNVRDIKVSVLGCELKLTAPDLTADFISDLHDKFAVGQRIELIVTEISGREDVDTSSFKSFCDTQNNMTLKAVTADSINRHDIIAQKLEKYPRGTVVRGTVNYVTDGGICVIALSNGCAAHCYATFLRRTPRRGDSVKFQVNRIDKERNRLTGRILEVERRTEF